MTKKARMMSQSEYTARQRAYKEEGERLRAEMELRKALAAMTPDDLVEIRAALDGDDDALDQIRHWRRRAEAAEKDGAA